MKFNVRHGVFTLILLMYLACLPMQEAEVEAVPA